MFTLILIYTLCALFREQVVIHQNDRAAEQKVAQWRAAHPDEKFIRF